MQWLRLLCACALQRKREREAAAAQQARGGDGADNGGHMMMMGGFAPMMMNPVQAMIAQARPGSRVCAAGLACCVREWGRGLLKEMRTSYEGPSAVAAHTESCKRHSCERMRQCPSAWCMRLPHACLASFIYYARGRAADELCTTCWDAAANMHFRCMQLSCCPACGQGMDGGACGP